MNTEGKKDWQKDNRDNENGPRANKKLAPQSVPPPPPPTGGELTTDQVIDLVGPSFAQQPTSWKVDDPSNIFSTTTTATATTMTTENPCIFCQRHPATLVLQPCGCVLVCPQCAKWACQKFCPQCRCTLSDKIPIKFTPTTLNPANPITTTHYDYDNNNTPPMPKPLTISPFVFMHIS